MPCFTLTDVLSWAFSFRRYKDAGVRSLAPSPRELICHREKYELSILQRQAIDPEHDTPLDALYRLYEHIMLDQNIEMRNELEAFWFHCDWKVCEIPDPKDPDPERYAVLAVIPTLLVLAFNKRIELGLPRHAPPIFTYDELDQWKREERKLEKEPDWVDGVIGCENQLAIPHWNNDQKKFITLSNLDDPGVSEEFAQKNILTLKLHIHFI